MYAFKICIRSHGLYSFINLKYQNLAFASPLLQMNRLDTLNNSLRFPHVYDYVIVGGGISGLQSAQILTLQTKNILLVEAQKVLGGRIQSISVTDLPASKTVDWILSQQQAFKKVKIQKGATWIEERHVVLRQFCKINNIPLKLQFSQGSSAFLAEKSYSASQLLSTETYGTQLKKFLLQIDQLAEEYTKHVLDSTQITQKYKFLLKKYDSMTVEQYLNKTIKSKQVRQLLETFLQHTQCISVDVNSMHEVLTKHGRSNDVGILKEFLGVQQHEASYLIEGSQIFINKYIESIQKNIKSNISAVTKLNSQVIQIDNMQKDLVVVTCLQKSGRPFKVLAKTVICAAPLQVVRNINFTNVSQNKRIVFDNQLRTNALKAFAVFKKPFWRQNGHSGDGLFSNSWMANMCHDISPEDQSCGILVFFLNGRKYYQWKSTFANFQEAKNYEQKLKYMKNLVAKIFNVQEGSKQHEEYFKDFFIGESGFMENPFIRSGFQSNTRPGTFTQVLQRGGDLSALYGDEHNIFFVGSEFSDSFASYIEGAIRVARNKMFKLIKRQDPMKNLLDKVNVVIKH